MLVGRSHSKAGRKSRRGAGVLCTTAGNPGAYLDDMVGGVSPSLLCEVLCVMLFVARQI